MNLELMANRLVAMGVGTLGDSIFINHMPESCEQGVLLRQQYSGAHIDWEIPTMRNSRFNMIVRAKRYQDADQLVRSATAALTMPHQTSEITGLDIKFCRPVNDPLAFPVSAAGYVEFMVIFNAVYGIVQ